MHSFDPLSQAVDSKSTMLRSEEDPLNWRRTASAMAGSHLEEVKALVKTFFECKQVVLEGGSLTVAHVAAVARRPAREVQVVLNGTIAMRRVEESARWVEDRVANGGDIYGVTTGFGATSHRRTQQGQELQTELIR